MGKSAAVSTKSELPVEKFVRIKVVTRRTDNYEAFQPEVIEVQGDKVVSRTLLGKPDLFEFAFAQAADLVDPRNG